MEGQASASGAHSRSRPYAAEQDRDRAAAAVAAATLPATLQQEDPVDAAALLGLPVAERLAALDDAP